MAAENQVWEVALRPGTAGKTPNPVSGKYSFMFVCLFWALITKIQPDIGRVGRVYREVVAHKKSLQEYRRP